MVKKMTIAQQLMYLSDLGDSPARKPTLADGLPHRRRA